MPYIAAVRRDAQRLGFPPLDAGELNYAVTAACRDYLERFGVSYQRLAEAVAALECAKLELYRRMAAPYEDMKIVENGDVFS